ncbi:MAG: hypothetical protein A3C61_00615 [Candidatus Yanofskybacteria bacterium RIFCSPHIGHO2_02_FULL_39_10]|uniref:Carbamate kinase n=1 Tax=Candidatus Yanofskybacteria bacterium RIFCSPHIGHO2_02_FULL_39_10 TaxID=1802674 RepID=A0A1F8F8L2_9BACT|nr:MAG: hypothetical protein A3C61_00615 [Candidatus Yanofskybacteria bacterium RIFCSPHIGHO2_02_FULL_39_10]
MENRIVIALGGNAIQGCHQEGTHEECILNVSEAIKSIRKIVADLHNKVAITHGNGPQVGKILAQNDSLNSGAIPLFVCDAMTQGQLGHFIQLAIKNLFSSDKIEREVLATVSTVLVDADDSAFKNPDKPIGNFYTKEKALKMTRDIGFIYKEDSGRGYRRVVPSPKPKYFLEIGTIKDLYEKGVIVITGGGGGIPVVIKGSVYQGIDAVIDKDRASALLANELNADCMIILTDVSGVALNYGRKDQRWVSLMTVAEAEQYLKDGQFALGSMGPKIESVLDFIGKNSKRYVIITNFESLDSAIGGNGGTKIFFK